MKSVSELRQDIVSGDWITIATGRSKRPQDFISSQKKKAAGKNSKKFCPFEKILDEAFYVALKDGEVHGYSKKTGPILEKEWFLQIVSNKYPAFGKGLCGVIKKEGPYQWEDGVGFHDVVVLRNHDKPFPLLEQWEMEIVIRAYRNRYLQLKDEDCIEYISIFHNDGSAAGASIFHPHSQIIAIPVIPPDVGRSIEGSGRFFHKYKKCVHCVMIDFERKEKTRIVYENDRYVAFAPFASRTAFEIRVFPKAHSPCFEDTHAENVAGFADAFRTALKKLYIGLGGISYNFFIHTSPAASPESLKHYHWHLEIVPKTAIWAGFEIGTGIDISTIAPEKAAAFLRGIK